MIMMNRENSVFPRWLVHELKNNFQVFNIRESSLFDIFKDFMKFLRNLCLLMTFLSDNCSVRPYIYIIKQDIIYKYVAFSWPNGWTTRTDFFVDTHGCRKCFRLKKTPKFFVSFNFFSTGNAGPVLLCNCRCR